MRSEEGDSFGAFWRTLNGTGRTALFVILLIVVALIIPGPPFDFLRGEGPAIPHYLAMTVLLMLDVPLTWTAWKVQKGYGRRGRVLLVVTAFLIGLVGLLEARFALQRGVEEIGFKTAIVLLWTLFVWIHGLGTRRPNDSTLNYLEQSTAVRG